MRRPRNLSPQERALWESVARQAKPLDRTTAKVSAIPAAPAPAPPPVTNSATPLPKFAVGQRVDHRKDHDLLSGLTQQLTARPVRMDAKAHRRLTRGKLRPEARIDLHGMTLAEAHPALLSFILTEHAAGTRLCLVITGKGKLRDREAPMPVRQGVLRHQVPQWLRLPPCAALVLQILPANIRHGGDGAYYVYLRSR